MRLTLRTMLAYLDDILEPEDTADIGRKIEDSEVAKTLARRIQEVIRRLRIGAPAVLDDNPLLDPNTAAEYLDNTLSADHVAEFEKACMENDTQLAEVAACHQILSIVLGEPAEVASSTREAMYRLAGTAKQPSEKDIVRSLFQEDLASEATATTDEHAPHSPEHGPSSAESRAVETPEAARLRWLFPAMMTVAVVGILLLAGAWIYRTYFSGSPIFGGNEQIAKTSSDAPAAADAATQAPRSGEGNARGTAGTSERLETGGTGQHATSLPTAEKAPEGGSDAPQAVGQDDETKMAATAPNGAPEQEAHPQSIGSAVPNPPEDGQLTEGSEPGSPGSDEAAASPPIVGPSQEQSPGPPVGMNPLPPTQPSDASPVLQQPAAPQAPSAPPAVLPDGNAAPLPPEEVGAFAPDGGLPQLLFRLTGRSGDFQIVGEGEKLSSYEQYFVPPGFRARVLLGGVEMIGIGPLFFDILSTDAAGSTGLAVSYGRMTLSADAASAGDSPGPPTLRLDLGKQAGLLQLRDSASVALDVRREGSIPEDPETQSLPWIVNLYVLAGEAVWADSEHARPMTLLPQVQVCLSERELRTVPLAEPVAWLNPPISAERLLEENAIGLILDALSGNAKSPLLVLEELSRHRRKEVAWLAQRSLAHLRHPVPLWQTLNDPAAKARWMPAIEELLAIVSQSPQSAAAVRASAEMEFGNRGPLLYALLWKYGTTLNRQQASELIDLLGRDELAIRVLAFWNLRRITGVTLNYEPSAVPVERQRAIQLWKARLEGPAGLPNISDRT